MIVLSNSLPKSGSTLFRNYTVDIVGTVSGGRGQSALRNLGLSGKVHLVGGFLPDVERDIQEIRLASAHAGPIVVKCHWPLTPTLREWIGPEVRVTYIYRDPRDVFLSARDHALRINDVGAPYFQDFLSDAHGISALRPMLEAAVAWKESGCAHLVRYEDLLSDPMSVLKELSEFLEMPVSAERIAAIIRREQENRSPHKNNFNVGGVYRYRSVMSPELLDAFRRELGDHITRLGYELD